MKISELMTEMRNPRSENLDRMSIMEILRLMNDEDRKVVSAVEEVLTEVEKAVNLVVQTLKDDGRVFYMGAGTSGRIGFLDAVEIPPTFSYPEDKFIPILAGGLEALRRAVEKSEDDEKMAIRDLEEHDFSKNDLLIGISASGRTPYVVSGMRYAKSLGARTICIVNNPNSEMEKLSDVAIVILTGPEIITGSTRLKAGTSQKMVLNMISTVSMVKLGKVYGNLMIDVNPTNEKLIKRAVEIIKIITEVDEKTAVEYLKRANMNPKTAVLMIKCGFDSERARKILNENEDNLRKALENSGC
ncbi:MAG: N-acetylmuramic acid 6-phosphate etherase [Thermotogae bacterium]|nr:N-acetylmuramic acid 6-phosphate etherase [Thermotogota bacterium]